MEKFAIVAFDIGLIDNPDNVTPGGYFVWLTRNNATVAQANIPATSREVSFTIDDIGTYVARAVRMTSTGASIGSAAESEPVTVVADQIAVPITVTLTIESTPSGLKIGG
jgi:hypothetical protein